MAFLTGALGTLLPKLAKLLHREYKLQQRVRSDIEFVIKELETTHAALRILAGEAPPPPAEQLHDNELVKIWARDAREISYDMEDVVDTFLVCVESCKNSPSRTRRAGKFVRKVKILVKRRQISKQIKRIKERVVELAARRDRYKVDTTLLQHANKSGYHLVTTLDPRMTHLYADSTELVGISKAKEELIVKLTQGDGTPTQQQRIVSIVGFGGLGKTTLAKAVYDKIKPQFDCAAFVTVSQNPDMRKFLKDLLYELDSSVYGEVHDRSLDEKHLIDIVRGFLRNKRYLIIIDDIWNSSHWDMIIKYALPDDNTGCRIIITTRKVTIANHIGSAYEMQPLSADNSKALLYRRIFGIEYPERYLNDELAEISNRILKKCAGVPLAIITVSSLLATKGRNKTEWDEVCCSIGRGMENSLDTENMKKILLYSYYDLPSHLRTCLLYLSIFPEDFKIKESRLIRLWIAEGFILREKQNKKSLFELGEFYFNELVNRNMIQPLYYYFSTETESCCVHDMILDLLCSISTEENFVTILRNMDQTSSSTIVRRLSLQYGKTYHTKTETIKSMPFVRSVVICPSALDQILDLRSFKVLRVLDLQGCDLSKGYSLQYLGSLFHMRYLSLKGTRIGQLPEVVGNLKFLEILNLHDSGIEQLPECIARLTHLLCLSVEMYTIVPNGIRSLTCLEELTRLHIDDESADILEGLGLLTELRVLSIMWRTNKWTDKLVESLRKLPKIQIFSILLECEGRPNLDGLDAWVFPPQLRTFHTFNVWWCSTLPAWMNNPIQFHDLTCLHIGVSEILLKDVKILGRLPALITLKLSVQRKNLSSRRRFVVGASLFPCLVYCRLLGFVGPMVFKQGAMRRLRHLSFEYNVPEAREIAGSGSDGGFDLGLANLLSLQEIDIHFSYHYSNVGEVEEIKAAVRREAEIYPNQPHLNI